MTEHGLCWVDDHLLPATSNIPESIASLEREYDEAMKPASEAEINAWLTFLWMQTKKQNSIGEFKIENVFTVYIAALRKFPRDMVKDAISSWAEVPKPKDAHHWWPSSGELIDTIRGPAETRRMIREAVKEWDMDTARHNRLSQLYRDLAVLEAGDFTFAIKKMIHASRREQIRAIETEAARVRAEIRQLEGPSYFAKAAGEG